MNEEFQSSVFSIPVDEQAAKMLDKMNEATVVFDIDESLTPLKIGTKTLRGYVPWGSDNKRPNAIMELKRKDEVMSSNGFFNILACYGVGLKTTAPGGEKVTDKEVKEFFKYNRPTRFLLEQVTDMKHFFFTVVVLILNGEGTKIVEIRHKDAMYCRFETCNPDTGKIEHVFFANWEKAPQEKDIETIELLDETNPLGDLEVRMGMRPGPDGKVGKKSEVRKFAIRNVFPTPGNKYYPFPYQWAVFNSGWYDIKQMVADAKKINFKNGLVIRYQVEINNNYWKEVFSVEKISDPKKQQERITKEKENIKSFLTGLANAGKVWFSGFYVDPNGKEQSMIRINVINSQKEGGEWTEDTEEASNMLCYADSVHPSLIGATPGKSSGSFSGSDKRELFTMKQALELPIRQLLLEPYFLVINFNGWEDKLEVDIPFIQLTTLDKKTDAGTNSTQNPNQNN